MLLIDYTTNSPEENIALDELLLLKAESGEAGESLRFWGSGEYFVVIGRAGKVREDCFIENCEKDGVKIIRRVSGGGTVLEGPGCLNFSLVLSYGADSLYASINSSYKAILGKICGALAEKGCPAEFRPICDIALNGKKISGNAQARKKRYFLHHGTLLYGLDIEMTEKYLKHPAKEPGYRLKRPHSDFIANMPLGEEALKDAVKSAFTVTGNAAKLSTKDHAFIKKLIEEKYSQDGWNLAF